MDFGLLVAQAKPVQPKAYEAVQSKSEPTTSFDQAFNQAIQTPVKETTTQNTQNTTDATTVEAVVEEVVEVIEADDLESVLNVLGIEHDESLAFVQIGEQLIPVETLMNIEDLTAALGMTPEELKNIVAQLLGDGVPTDDVWQLLEQAPALLAQITSLLQGEQSTVTPKEAGKVIEFLKLAQVVGMKTDTVYQQEFQLKETKNQLQTLLSQLTLAKPAEKAQKQTFQQVLQVTQTVQTTETAAPKPQVQQMDTAQNNLGQATLTQATTKTITVTLPTTNTAAQSEALVKQIEQVINRNQLSNNQGQIKLLLKLYPENLGQIRVELFHKDGVMQARLLASTGQAKDLLDANLNQLKTALAGQNIQMERIDIAQSLQSTEQSSRDQNFFNNFFRQQQEEQEEQKNEEDEQVTFEEFLQQQVEAEEVEV